MLSAILPLALLATAAVSNPLERRDPAADLAAFTSAADALISSYIPADKWALLTSAIGPAASSAGVTGDVKSLVFSALEATSLPEWFANAIPTQYAGQISALENAIDSIRPTAVPGSPIPTIIVATTTDAAGNTVTTTFSTTITVSIPTISTDVGGLTSLFPTVIAITTTDANGSTYTTISTLPFAGSLTLPSIPSIPTTLPTLPSIPTTLPTIPISLPTGTFSGGTVGRPSTTSTPNAAMPTAFSGNVAGVMAIVGLVMAI